MSLFVAGAAFGEDQVSLFVAGAAFGEVQVSLFVAGAVFGEIWNDSRGANRCIFQYKMQVLSAKSDLGCEAGCGLTVSCSDHGRIGPEKLRGNFGESFFVAGAVFGDVGGYTLLLRAVIFRGRCSIW